MRTRLSTAVAVGCLLALSGCGSDPTTGSAPSEVASSSAPAAAASSVPSVSAGATIIDVRTPEEFDAGHLQGAVNIDASADDFADRVAELDRAGTYVVYCRTGNRSAAAAAVMTEQGFETVTDAGGYEKAAAELGLPIVTD